MQELEEDLDVPLTSFDHDDRDVWIVGARKDNVLM